MLLKLDLDGGANTATASRRFVESEAWKHYRDTGKMRWREFATAPKYGSLWEQAADVASTLLGTLGLSEAVTDNASVNVVPLQARAAVVGGGAGRSWGARRQHRWQARLAPAPAHMPYAAHCLPPLCTGRPRRGYD